MPTILPTWFRVLPKGNYPTTKGMLLVDDLALSSVIDAFKRYGNDILIDYEHQSMSRIDNLYPVGHPNYDPESDIAAGWIAGLEVRADGLWATGVTWTAKASRYLQNREFRYFSPTLNYTYLPDVNKSRPIELCSVALTNTPASVGLEPLIASRNKGVTMNKAIALSLKLGGDATEDTVVSKIEQLVLSNTTLSNTLDSLLALAGVKTADEAKAKIITLTAAGEQAVTLAKRVEQLEMAQLNTERDQLIAAAESEGKVSPALKQILLSQSLAVVKDVIPGLTVIPQFKNATEPNTGTQSSTVALSHNGKTWAELEAYERHDLYFTDKQLYEAMKNGGK